MTPRGRLLAAAGVAAGLVIGAIAASAVWVHATSRGRTYAIENVPAVPLAMVLGAETYPDGTLSPFLAARLDTAAQLLASGRVQRLRVTGDGSAAGVDEAKAMRQYLVDTGVDPAVIDVDVDGVDTHASCVNAKAEGHDSLVVVSQTYHLPRAIALCRAVGIDAVGVGDDSARRYAAAWRSGEVREWFAGVKAATDVIGDRFH